MNRKNSKKLASTATMPGIGNRKRLFSLLGQLSAKLDWYKGNRRQGDVNREFVVASREYGIGSRGQEVANRDEKDS